MASPHDAQRRGVVTIYQEFTLAPNAELHRLRGVFLVAIGADETQIEASFQVARQNRKGAEVDLTRKTRRNNAVRPDQRAHPRQGPGTGRSEGAGRQNLYDLAFARGRGQAAGRLRRNKIGRTVE